MYLINSITPTEVTVRHIQRNYINKLGPDGASSVWVESCTSRRCFLCKSGLGHIVCVVLETCPFLQRSGRVTTRNKGNTSVRHQSV